MSFTSTSLMEVSGIFRKTEIAAEPELPSKRKIPHVDGRPHPAEAPPGVAVLLCQRIAV